MYTWCEIDSGALKSNIAKIRSRLFSDVLFMSVVKQDAYGHGLVEVSKVLDDSETDFLGVHAEDEALELIESGIKKPVLIMSNILPNNTLKTLIANSVRFSVRDEHLLEKLNRTAADLGKQAFIHIKVDTGMNRLGVNSDVAVPFIMNSLEKYKNLQLEGIFSHFSSADTDNEYTNFQLNSFNLIVKALSEKGINVPVKHISNSAGIMNVPKAQFDLVRSGIAIYGAYSGTGGEELLPVLSLKTKVIHLKGIPASSSVSYAGTFKTTRNTLLAVVDTGYGHGYPWSLSNKTEVIINGRRRKIVGRVCMDHMLADVTDDPDVKVGDTVTLIGNDGDQRITAVELAQKAGTISYEILTRLQHIPKRYK